MEAKDLRIGNWIGRKPVNKNIPDIQLNKHGLINILNHDWYLETFYPLELTEEWLIKFGFESKELYHWHGNDADWTPDYPRTYHKDYVLKDFIFRYIKWQYMSKQIINTENSQEILVSEWYEKVGEGIVRFEYEIKYVHELQNLYYWLYKKELELKE